MTESLTLHPDRFFDAEPAVRGIARQLYDEVHDLPLVCPHGHVDPRSLAENAPFPEPAALLITPDHYVVRMLYSQGVPMEALGVGRAQSGTPAPDPRVIWRDFAARFHLFAGTPTGAWLTQTLHDVFGVRCRPSRESADLVYDQVAERLGSPEYRPRALFERFRIDVLATTDAATDTLEHHAAIRDSGWHGRVIPTFRPDALFRITHPDWPGHIARLERACSTPPIRSARALVDALATRRSFFRTFGATATDHGVQEPVTLRISEERAERLFATALAGGATRADEREFVAHLLMEMARLSTDDGMVMQLHAGALRDYNGPVARRFGPDVGGDIPVATEFTQNLRPLLETYGNDARLRLILFTLDESTYSRELAPIAGHFPAVRLGPPWWFHDSVEGMTRFRQQTTETAGLWNTAGFNDDTRAFCSIPARHDLARRVDANWLAGMVARHQLDIDEARRLAVALAGDLARETYRLAPAPEFN